MLGSSSRVRAFPTVFPRESDPSELCLAHDVGRVLATLWLCLCLILCPPPGFRVGYGSGETRLSKSVYIIELVVISNGVVPVGSTADFDIVTARRANCCSRKNFDKAFKLFSCWVAKFIGMQPDIFTAEMGDLHRAPWLCDNGSRR